MDGAIATVRPGRHDRCVDDEQGAGFAMGALREIAWRYLAEGDAGRWETLVRPSIRLATEDEVWDAAEEPSAAGLGGLPRLPRDIDWPTGPEGAPLAFIAALDCAALLSGWLDIPLPAQGVLTFFAATPLDRGPSGLYRAGRCGPTHGRVLYIPAGTPCEVRAAPPGVAVFPGIRLIALRDPTAPFPDHPRVRHAFDLHTRAELFEHPLYDQSFLDELAEQAARFEHRVGGYASAGAVEYEAALGPTEPAAETHPRDAGPHDTERALEWVMLAQFQCDPMAEMLACDRQDGRPGSDRRGVLMWLIRHEDLARQSFSEAVLLRAF
ncbi:DUF1963 domain-containing protein [Nocardia amikacinitolerans]|uniref:DUF1963 domain-containing protein n=1 Tax=Nocardia amikacinitolerans TaxID=756689 RepID=UPI00367E9315